MQKRVILRTARKLGVFFGFLAFLIVGIFGSAFLGAYLFNEPAIGNIIFIIFFAVGTIAFFAYSEAKSEVEYENKMLIQELTKND